MDASSKGLGLHPPATGRVQVNLSADHTRLIGRCPTCGSDLSIDLRSDGSHGALVACLRCKEVYWAEMSPASEELQEDPNGLVILFGVEGSWDPPAIMEYLFDNIGAVHPIRGGFVCHPDEECAGLPTITVDTGARTVSFGIFGTLSEREAGGVINQAVSEFGARFQVDLQPMWVERWVCREDGQGFRLNERRPVGLLLRDGVRGSAHV